MELLVCIKQVPDDSVSVGLNADGTPKLDEITPVVNAFDTYALEMAARFKEAHGGSVTVLTVGGESPPCAAAWLWVRIGPAAWPMSLPAIPRGLPICWPRPPRRPASSPSM